MLARSRAFDSHPIAAVGLVSYSVFLWHGPVIDYLREHDHTSSGRTGFLANLAIVLTITFFLSLVTYRYVERPALRLKGRRRDKSATSVARRTLHLEDARILPIPGWLARRLRAAGRAAGPSAPGRRSWCSG
jgi:peptidoglycan/LPS O-acetylase OafA/YrhL